MWNNVLHECWRVPLVPFLGFASALDHFQQTSNLVHMRDRCDVSVCLKSSLSSRPWSSCKAALHAMVALLQSETRLACSFVLLHLSIFSARLLALMRIVDRANNYTVW